MKRNVCPRCGSSNIDWIIPQVWSKWVCKDCSYTGPAIEADDDLIAEIKADWEEENIRAQQILSGEDEILDEEMEIEEEDELSEEELDKKLRELNL